MLQDKRSISIPTRLPLVDALRAVTATLVACHHFVLYGPLASWAFPEAAIAGLRDYRWAVQVFFVIGGYVMARSMSPRVWNRRQVGRFAIRRYCRLGLPYLAAVALAMGACAVGRGQLPESVVGPPPTVDQVLAHAVFLQDILKYPALSAGLWFVCIDFQLGLVYVALLYLRDAFARLSGRPEGESAAVVPWLLGWALALSSLFFFNVDGRWDVWAVYFFGQFFLGVMVYHGLKGGGWTILFWLYVITIIVALAYCWRWRLITSLVAGVALFGGGKLGLMERWPESRVIGNLGRTSYSLFLIHFPVLIVVTTVWITFDWSSPRQAEAGLLVSYLASLLVAEAFFQAVEAPAVQLSRKFS